MTHNDIYTELIDWYSDEDHPLGVSGDGSRCLYRGNGDRFSSTRCSVGVFIPDNQYSSDMEGAGFGDLIDTYPALQDTFSSFDRELWSEIQAAHDDFAMSRDSTPSVSRQLFVDWLTDRRARLYA